MPTQTVVNTELKGISAVETRGLQQVPKTIQTTKKAEQAQGCSVRKSSSMFRLKAVQQEAYTSIITALDPTFGRGQIELKMPFLKK